MVSSQGKEFIQLKQSKADTDTSVFYLVQVNVYSMGALLARGRQAAG